MKTKFDNADDGGVDGSGAATMKLYGTSFIQFEFDCQVKDKKSVLSFGNMK